MRAPQIIMAAMFAADSLWEAYKHGQPKEGKYNIWTTLIAVAANVALLWWGGFWGGK